MKKIDVRKATNEDASFLALSMLQSSRGTQKIGIFDLLFDAADDMVLLQKLQYLLTIEPKIYCYFTNFWIASSEGENIGTLCAYEPRISSTTLLENLLDTIGINKDYDVHSSMIALCSFEMSKSVLMVDFLHVKAGIVALEVVKELFKKCLLTASLKGYRIVRTIVNSDHLDTMLLYKKLGFTVVSEKKCAFFQESFGHSGVAMLEYHL
jgi:hypothetical protein